MFFFSGQRVWVGGQMVGVFLGFLLGLGRGLERLGGKGGREKGGVVML